ncbi:MAG: amidohydrolase family protein [Chloroflexi bacterium]|nr:amidohydrolase family protein [Chloroflexota bacterium]
MLDVVIRGGTVVTPEGVGLWDVGVQGERIVAIAAPGSLDDAGRVVDASGKLVIPGGVDPHIHSEMAIPGWQGPVTLSGSLSQISRAALFGGTTTLLDFATWEGAGGIEEVIREKEGTFSEVYTDWALHFMFTGNVTPELIEQIPEAISAGYPSFKVYTTNVLPTRLGRMVPFGLIWEVMQQVARHGGIMAIHAEDNDLVMHMYEKLNREERNAFENMPLAHTPMSEDLSFRRIIRLARYVEGAALYMMHTSAKAGVAAIAEARADGFPIYGETLHNYAAFTAEAYRRPDGVIYHTYPSLKYEEDRQGLWDGMASGEINAVATDEVCTPRAIKVRGKTINDATGGHVGSETRVPVVYSEAVVKRGLSLERFVELIATNAAKLHGLYPRKGVLAVGSDADVVVFDPSVQKTIGLDDLHDSDYSLWEGFEVTGWPVLTMLRGKVVVQQGQLTDAAGAGTKLFRKLEGGVQNGPAVC